MNIFQLLLVGSVAASSIFIGMGASYMAGENPITASNDRIQELHGIMESSR